MNVCFEEDLTRFCTATKIEDLNWDERLEMHVMTTVMTVTVYFQVGTGYVLWEPAPSLLVPETEMCQEDRDAVRNVLLLVSNKDIYAGKRGAF